MRYAGIKKNDIVDVGSGIAVSVWMQGCPNHCSGCHNPQTWDPEGGEEIDLEDLIQEVIEALGDNDIQRDLSILGGEPLAPYNQYATMEIIRLAKAQYPMLKVYLWTGYTYEYLLSHGTHDSMDILCMTDVLIEGPYIEDLRDITLPLRGSSNQRIMVHDKSLKPMCFREITDIGELQNEKNY